jgi:allantoicase
MDGWEARRRREAGHGGVSLVPSRAVMMGWH